MDELWITEFLNKFMAGPVNALLAALNIHAKDAANPITDAVAMQLVVAALLLIYFALVRARLSVDDPGGIQHFAEVLHEMFFQLSKDIIGHRHMDFLPYVMTLGLFIVTSNLIGLVPGLMSPTQTPAVPLGCALMTFVYYNAHGVRQQGFWRYMGHFCGPVWWLAWLMFPIEIISHLARIMSLTIRLFANMFAGELVTLAFFSLIPIGVPIIFLGLHLGVALLQAFIFVLLTMIYLSMAVEEAEGH